MSAWLRSFRRAPARLIASVAAIALAVGAIGVFAVPDVAASTLRDLAKEDHLAHIAVDTTSGVVAAEIDIEGSQAIETRSVGAVDSADHGRLQVVAFDAESQAINIVGAQTGTLPTFREVLVTDGVAEIGDRIVVGSTPLTVVGTGGTAWWSDTDTIYVTPDTALSLGVETTRLLVRLDDPSNRSLEVAVDELRSQVAMTGDSFAAFPEVVSDGKHPVEEDLVQISTMIGLLGVVAGVVALTLLASTTTALITERSREVAVMRALGARRRPLRRRLRRLAFGVSIAGLAIGIPLGIIVSNVVARMILQRFVGVTPGIAVSFTVIVASALFAITGAVAVSTRSARRVTKLPLADALRDRAGDAYGRRLGDRLFSRLRVGGLLARLALRNNVRKRARSVSTVVQVAAGVGAVIVVASLATSVNAFNAAETEPWSWQERAIAVAPGLTLPEDEVAGPGVEAGITVFGEVNDWEVEVRGISPATKIFDSTVEAGHWLTNDRGVVLSQGFADRQGLAIGDTVVVDLAPGTLEYQLVGLHRSRSRDVYISTDVLAIDLGAPGFVNTAYSFDSALPDLGVAADVVSVEDMSAEDAASRDAVVAVFMAIGGIVAGVSALGVSSLLALSLHERRYEVATLAAIGGRRADIRRTLWLELVPLAVAGAALGVAVGFLGATGIIAAFEASSAVEIGMVFARGAVLPTVGSALALVVLIGWTAARRATAQPAAVMLRGAA